MTVTRKWQIGAVLVVALIVIAGWFLLIAPQRASVADLEAQTQSQLDTNSSLETQKALLEQQYKDLPEKQAELAALQTQLPQSPELPSYVRQLQDISKKSGAALVSMTPAAAISMGAPATAEDTALAPDMLAAMNVDLVVRGSFFEVTKFINDLETTPRYTLVGGMTIAESEDTAGEVSAVTDLTATLNARIYLVPTAVEVAPVTGESPAPTTTPAP